MKDSLKQLESNLSDLFCDRLNEMLSCNASLGARITSLENEVRTLRRSQSYASQASHIHQGVSSSSHKRSTVNFPSASKYQRPLSYQQQPTMSGSSRTLDLQQGLRPNLHIRECKSLDPRNQGDEFNMTHLDISDSSDLEPSEHEA